MSSTSEPKLYHSNRYAADSACEHCGGIIRHQTWCITRNPAVFQAYACVLDENQLTEQDRLILHALGVAWKTGPCGGPCASPANA